MAGDILQVGTLRRQKNFVPLPYRRVSFQPYQGEMTEAAITAHLLNREVYRRTDVIVLHTADNQYAVAAVQRLDSESLFTRLAADCVYLHDANTDVANPSALAKIARLNGVGKQQIAIVEGKFDHINIIHHPDSIRLCVVEAVLLALATKCGKQTAHTVVYELAMQTQQQGGNFKTALAADVRITAFLSATELDELFKLENRLGACAEMVAQLINTLGARYDNRYSPSIFSRLFHAINRRVTFSKNAGD
jgi:hypothetical protein